MINNLHTDVDKAIKAVISFHGACWPEAIRNLEQFIKYRSKQTTKENIKKANAILKLLQPKKEDMDERLNLYIKTDSDLYDLKESRIENTKYNKFFIALVEDFKIYLENEEDNKIISTFQILFHGKQSHTIPFAKEVSQKLKNPVNIAALLLDLIKKWKTDKNFDPSFLCGFLAGLNEKNQAEAQNILDTISNDNHLADLVMPSYLNLHLKDQDIKRLIETMSSKKGRNKC